MEITPKKWYESAFESDYLLRYAHRNQIDAEREVAWIEQAISPAKDWLICDACCGQGRHLDAWQAQGYRAIGFDLSADLLAESTASVYRGDQRQWALRANCCDLITVMFTSIGYFESDAENQLIFSEIARCLKPGGRFVIDAVDVEYLNKNFVADTIKEIQGGRLIENRRLEGQRVIKDVCYETPQGIKEYQESVRLFTKDEYQEICYRHSLNIDEWRNGFGERATGRALLLGTKI